MILIDTVYINEFGGKVILELFLKKILSSKINYHLILDSRLKSKQVEKIKTINYTIVNASHLNRKNFYLKNINRFSSILCLANIPPPINTSIETTIFFHNCLLLNPLSHPISLKSLIINFLKFNYIKYYNQNDYNWIVQTPYIYKLLRNNLIINFDQVSIFPVFKKVSQLNAIKKCNNDFVYVSSSSSHKNHIRLIKAFKDAANKTFKEINLHLTLYKADLPKSVLPKNLKIKFHGTLSIDSVNELYNSCEFAIYPSLVESFGLPLIEATNHGCKVIASDLPYVHQIIEPSLTFDPYSVKSMADAILNAINEDDLPKTKVLVDNKLDNFIKFIISQDVQK